MGKANRKMNKNKKNKGQKVQTEKLQELREELRDLFTEEKYSDVINKLAELVQDGDHDAEMLYDGAYSYFMLGDYTRAAGMVQNVLTFDQGHLAARILLARICILEDRTDDSLAIFDFVLEHGENVLTQEQREDIEDILDYYGRNEAEHIKAEFPHVAGFLGLAPLAEETESVAAPTPAVKVQTVEPQAAMPQAAEQGGDYRSEIQAVLTKDISLSDKIRLLQVFAGGHYMAGDYQAAAAFLEAALGIDGQDENVLRNLAITAKRMGKTEKAWEFAAKLPQTDLLLVDFLMQ